MPILLHDLLFKQALKSPESNAIGYKNTWLSYQELSKVCLQASRSFNALGVNKAQRVVVYLPKNLESVISYFAISLSGGIFVPVNPILKAPQVTHIIQDCSGEVLITNTSRLDKLSIEALKTVKSIILIDGKSRTIAGIKVWHWSDFMSIDLDSSGTSPMIDSDIAAIFYTSGSTGNAKGVVLSHLNIVMGAKSVSAYLPCKNTDKMLALQPFSFDYGFSQLTIAFLTGASCYLADYFFINDVFKIIQREQITSLALVPPLWIKLANAYWPSEVGKNIRYFCNTGGKMPASTLAKLRDNMPNAEPYLMYGLTEAFRSCYLPPSEIDSRPNSFGKAIPNAQVMVINEQGEKCAPYENGELVHRGALVSQGYWNDTLKTAERFKPVPNSLSQLPLAEIAVWSGDIVHTDDDGYFYFVSRKDDMIKTSGYRVSPQEVENILNQMPLICEAVVIGVPHEALGQALVAIITTQDPNLTSNSVLKFCTEFLPHYMLPKLIKFSETLPRNSNEKYDRGYWKNEFKNIF
ncbi:acyl-CoA ligase (AMP-forming), exosortase A system-associated [Pseudoalteromonas denitrificans]|uniref:Acyl-CoA ligase (AMP-forming), exosortase A-associated n=1 Tax=Pseudoalteromonas denitrificans DSM 6059 TaxID=1123010 RepID=A0A1I1PU00_9GAMM|nr:acyl-CoA ligase (AMP-forming), exosortase A system-associated [Pseudoalteromonas denitrificans]SFD09410.1 acyl-CoA ligase (AMP-forming), exosortase A-associated [Pseudoalteromonas denitrificans DSM 6059]